MLAPDAQDLGVRRNDESLVMKLIYGTTSVLLEGDAERNSEQRMAEEQPQADLLKVAHHGSATSTIPQLLAAVHPHFAVISVGARNTYGHPRRDVLARLAEAQVRTYRTDDGAVTFTWMAKPSALVFPNPADVDFRGLIAARGLAVLFNHAPGLAGIFLAHENNCAPDAGKNILLSVQRSDVGINSRRLQQAVHH